MRKLVIGLTLAMLLLAATAVPAFAHVHAITPLLSCTVDNANSGAEAAEGDPIKGLIPKDVGNSPLGFGDGGLNATDCEPPA